MAHHWFDAFWVGLCFLQIKSNIVSRDMYLSTKIHLHRLSQVKKTHKDFLANTWPKKKDIF